MKILRKRLIPLFLLIALPLVIFSQVDLDRYAAHQECIGRCYGNQSICEFDALSAWFDCWNYCWNTYGPYAGTWEYTPYTPYYHEGCEIACDYHFDQALFYCDEAFDHCECRCIQNTSGFWGWIYGFDC